MQMKISQSIRQTWKHLREQYHASRCQKRVQYLNNLSCENLNVIEFNGRLYISYNGVPVVRVDDLKGKVPDILAQSREDYLLWKDKFNM